MKIVKKWLGLCVLAMLMTLAGITVFAKDLGSRAYSTYYPGAVLQKVWEDNDNALGTRPESLDVNVAYLDYYGVRQTKKVTLSEDNNWSYRFPGEWQVAYDGEENLTGDYGFKSYEVIEQGDDNYLLQVTNGLRYPVDYAWTWEDENGEYQTRENGYAYQYLPSEGKYVAGTKVDVSSSPYKGSTATGDGVRYAFTGWDRQDEFIMPAEAVTINGKWKRVQQYNVSYSWSGLPDAAGVTPPEERQYYEYDWVYVNSSYRKGIYVKAGEDTYRFSGWSTDWEGVGDSSSFRMPDQNVHFTGKWEKVGAYTLTYKWKWDNGDGNLSDTAPGSWYQSLPDSRIYAEDDEVSRDWCNKGYNYSIGSGDNRQLYVFSGWKEESYDDLEQFNNADEMKETFSMPGENMTLYGVWKKRDTYKVRYEWTWEGLDNAPSSPYLYQPSSYSFYEGQQVSGYNTSYVEGTMYNVNGSRYQFSGWTAYVDGTDGAKLDCDNAGFSMPAYNIVFKGQWEKVDAYTVEYQWDGLPEANQWGSAVDKDGYSTSVINMPEDRNSPYQAGAIVYKDTVSDQYVQNEPIDMSKAYKLTWSKYNYDTYQNDYKYNYYTFSGWTAYDKDEYTGNKDDVKPLELSFDENGAFMMPAKNILFVGQWKEIPSATYTVTWYKIASANADPDTATLIVRSPNPDTRTAQVNAEVSVTDRDKEDINEYGMYQFVEDYQYNVTTGKVLSDGSLELKLYFVAQKGDPGHLKVSKTVAGNAGDQTKDFKFTVTLSDQTISGDYGEMTFKDGESEFVL